MDLLQAAYRKAIGVFLRRIDEGDGDRKPPTLHFDEVDEEGGAYVDLEYRTGPSPRLPTYRDLAKIFNVWSHVTTVDSRPERNPFFSRETRFVLAFASGPHPRRVAGGWLELGETDSGLLASN